MNSQFRHKSRSTSKQKNDWKSRIWTSNIFSVFLIVLLIVSFIKVGQEIMLRWEIKNEINTLQSQLNELEGKTAKMDKLISYLQTDEYIEKQARLELNLSKPGEKQINLVNFEENEDINLEDQLSNSQKWFNYFFK